ncbi:MAG: hypothetical protein FJ279_12130 [Planctomycetes bacterium]|nr:hypothetical protein [Planctomycetota bacterium]MBM4078666.1 hypothetical protein [Planctomycetota bacterium]
MAKAWRALTAWGLAVLAVACWPERTWAGEAVKKEPRPSSAERPIALCSIGQLRPWVDRAIDPAYKAKLNAQGYQVGWLEYAQVTPARLKPFNVLLS